jgi:hypothetical protein
MRRAGTLTSGTVNILKKRKEEQEQGHCHTVRYHTVSIYPLKLVTMPNSSQVKTLVRTTSMQMSFPETVSDNLCRNSSVVQTQFHQLSGWAGLRRSRRRRSRVWRSLVGMGTRGLRL